MSFKRTQFSKILMTGFLGLLILSFAGAAMAGERIIVEMNNGDRLEGELIKKDENNLYMYFGGKIISISQKKVKSLKTAGIQEASTNKAMNFEFYKTANLPVKSVQTHVKELGQAVVLVKTPSGLGTGWFCNQKGYLITNNHVVAKEKSITVTIFPRKGQGFGKKVYKKVKIIALNADLDLALLKIEEEIHENYPQLFLGDSSQLKAGEKVFLIGNPLGLERSTSEGIISKVSRNYGGRLYLQTTAPISPGNSGGPLFNERGEVVGVINMGFKYLDGLGFAIPSRYIKEFLDNIEAFAYDNDNPNNGFQYMEAPITTTDRKIRFTDTEFIKSSYGISHLTLADLNGDSIKEIIFANNDKAEIEIIRLANESDQKKLKKSTDLEDINRLKESDRFASDTITVTSKIYSLGVGDFTGDKRPDIVFYGDVDGLAILEQKADGTFKTAKKIDDIKILERQTALKVIDINGDGRKDIFTMGKKVFTIFLSGKEKKEYPLNSNYVNKIKHYDIMDINEDGRKDIIFFVLDKNYAVYVRLQNEEGGFVEEIPVRSNISGPVVRYFGDNKAKFLTLDSGLNRVREIVLAKEKEKKKSGNIPSGFLTVPLGSEGGISSNIKLGNMDGDEALEMLTVDRLSNEFITLDREGDTFKLIRSPSPKEVTQFELYAGRKKKAIVISFSMKDKIFGISRVENGKVSFPRPLTYQGTIQFMRLGRFFSKRTVLLWVEKSGDKYFVRYIPADRLLDAVYQNESGSLDVKAKTLHFDFKGKKGGMTSFLTQKPDKLSFADFNGDGRKDLVVYWSYSDKESLFLGMGKGQFREIIKDQKVLGGASILSEDINGNGQKDVLLVQSDYVRLLKVDKKNKLYIKQQINWKFDPLKRLVFYRKRGRTPQFLALAGKKLMLVEYNSKKKVFVVKEKRDLTGMGNNRIKVGSITGNGIPDILILGGGVIHLYLNKNNHLTLNSKVIMNTKTQYYLYWKIFSCDLDMDKRDEILLFDSKKAMFEIYRKGKGGRLKGILRQRLFTKTIFQRGSSVYELPKQVQIGDVDGNGKPDFICILQDRIAIYLQDTKKL